MARLIVPVFLVVAAVLFARAPFLIRDAPMETTMGLIQKIFYFHVPSAMLTFLSAFVCGGASIAYLIRRRRAADHLAVAGAELAVLFGLIVLVTGPLWARKAWGVWWEWDVRLTTTLIMWMIFVAYLMLRRFGGPGSEVLSAAVAVFGMALVPFVYISVNYWRTHHPDTNVVPTLPPELAGPFWWSVASFVILFVPMVIVRARLEASRARLEDAYAALED